LGNFSCSAGGERWPEVPGEVDIQVGAENGTKIEQKPRFWNQNTRVEKSQIRVFMVLPMESLPEKHWWRNLARGVW
jgi:hypothetical protein